MDEPQACTRENLARALYEEFADWLVYQDQHGGGLFVHGGCGTLCRVGHVFGIEDVAQEGFNIYRRRIAAQEVAKLPSEEDKS